MLVVKKVNNNVAICIDGSHRELVAFGKGIGFPQMPYELKELNLIQRTYYGVSPIILNAINDIPDEIFEVSAKIIDIAQKKISTPFNSSIVFTLSDHIHFAIKRFKENIKIAPPFQYNIRHLYEVEMEIGEIAVSLIQNKLGIPIPEEEAINIALHIINAETSTASAASVINESEIIDTIIQIIEKRFELNINRQSFNFARFVTHLNYLLKANAHTIKEKTENQKLYESIVQDFPTENSCAIEISHYLEKTLNLRQQKEELLYLMIHINRLCSREDCN